MIKKTIILMLILLVLAQADSSGRMVSKRKAGYKPTSKLIRRNPPSSKEIADVAAVLDRTSGEVR